MADEIKQAVFGNPEWHGKIHNEFRRCFDEAFPRLTDALTQVIYRTEYPNPTQLQHVVLKLGELSMMSMKELITLLGNGMGQAAFKILRSMLENTINAGYLRQHPEEVDNFLNWHWIEKHREMLYMKNHMPTAYSTLTPEQIQETEQEYKRVLPNFLNRKKKLRPTWAKRDLGSRAWKAGLQEHYLLVYPLASSLFHGSVAGLSFYFEPDEDPDRLTPPPSMKWCGQSLISGHSLALEMLKILCVTFKKETNPTAVELEEEYRKVWAQPPALQ